MTTESLRAAIAAVLQRRAPGVRLITLDGPGGASAWVSTEAPAERDAVLAIACALGLRVEGDAVIDPAPLLGDLLARIHRDGGHRAEAVGWARAADEADEIVAGLLSRSEEVERLTRERDEARADVGFVENARDAYREDISLFRTRSYEAAAILDALRAEAARLTARDRALCEDLSQRDAAIAVLTAEVERVTAERDALRAAAREYLAAESSRDEAAEAVSIVKRQVSYDLATVDDAIEATRVCGAATRRHVEARKALRAMVTP